MNNSRSYNKGWTWPFLFLQVSCPSLDSYSTTCVTDITDARKHNCTWHVHGGTAEDVLTIALSQYAVPLKPFVPIPGEKGTLLTGIVDSTAA